ncbi:MAG: hypothetical protein AAGF04_01810 [Chlamydiota bacterium]
MSVKITTTCAPFSQAFGCFVPLLKTSWTVQIYPTCLLFQGEGKGAKVTFSMTGPFSSFLCTLAPDRERIEIRGKGQEGFFSFHIVSEKSIRLVVKKKPDSCSLHFSGTPLEEIPVYSVPKNREKLSLGVHKKQDIEAIRRRGDLQEILPIWHGIARLYPREKEAIFSDLSLFYRTFWAEFGGIFCPQEDPFLLKIPQKISQPFSYGSQLISSLFFQQKGNTLHFLPKMQFPFGKMTGIEAEKIGILDFAWSKKKVRKVVLRATTSTEITLRVSGMRHFRLFENQKLHTKKMLLTRAIEIAKGRLYVFDRFER